MKQTIRYIIINGIFALSLYYGFFENNEFATNLALVMAWVTGIAGTLMLIAMMIPGGSHEIGKSMSRKEWKPGAPRWVDIMFDLGVLCVIIMFGHYILSVFYAISIAAGIEVRKLYQAYSAVFRRGIS